MMVDYMVAMFHQLELICIFHVKFVLDGRIWLPLNRPSRRQIVLNICIYDYLEKFYPSVALVIYQCPISLYFLQVHVR